MRTRKPSTTKKSSKNAIALTIGIGFSSIALGSIATHLIHSSNTTPSPIQIIKSSADEQKAIQDLEAQKQLAKQAHLTALEAEDKWYQEIAKTQKSRAENQVTNKEMQQRIDALQAEKLELIDLQKTARIEKQLASEAAIHSIRAQSNAKAHMLTAYETTQLAEADQEKANIILARHANLENELQSAKLKYATLEAKYQIILNDNHRLALKTNQEHQVDKVQREIIVVNNTSPTTTEYHQNHPTHTIIETSGHNTNHNHNNFHPTKPHPRTHPRPKPQIQILKKETSNSSLFKQ
ncbi:MAG: hypothetical protein ACSHX6_06340 [Akkermansiaceae bacterium]